MTRPGAIVGLVSPRYAPALGGVERHVEMLARGLVRRGVGVEVITSDPSGCLPSIEARDGVLVRRFATIAHDAVYFLAPGLGWWLARNAAGFTVLHAHSYHTPLALQAALASWWSGTPFVVTTHYHGTGHSPARRALHAPYRLAGHWLLHRAQRVICVSQTERALLHRHFGSAISTTVIPNGVEVEELVTAAPREKPSGEVRVLAVGRLEPYKQTERVVRALRRLPPNYHLAIVGDGPARPQIERMAVQLGVQARLCLLGHLARPELLSWYRTSDVLVSLSRHEAFGLTVLEAAVAGAAVVVSDIPAHREVAGYVPEGQVLFVNPHASPEDLAIAIQRAAHRPWPPSTARTPIPTWEGAVERTLACYWAALGASGPTVRSEIPDSSDVAA